MKKTKENYDFDLILPKEVYDKQQKEMIMQIKKNNEKNEKQKTKIKIIMILLFALSFLTLLYANKKLVDDYMKSCQENGYSYNYCLEHS